MMEKIIKNSELQAFLNSLNWKKHLRFGVDVYESVNLAEIANFSLLLSTQIQFMNNFTIDDFHYLVKGQTLERTNPKMSRPEPQRKFKVISRPGQRIGGGF